MKRKITSAIAAAGALLALPGTAVGANPFGSPLTEDPSGGETPTPRSAGLRPSG